MKITAHCCLERLIYEAVVAFQEAKGEYEKQQKYFFYKNGNPNDFRKAKRENDEAMQRLSDLVTAQRIIKEIEDKGVEI